MAEDVAGPLTGLMLGLSLSGMSAVTEPWPKFLSEGPRSTRLFCCGSTP
jgi:hypothetical protein